MAGLRFLALFMLLSVINGQSYILSIPEEKPRDTHVGNIQNDPQFSRVLPPANRTNLKFMFFGQRSEWITSFRVEEATGDIYTTASLDRETICPTLPTECSLDFDVAAYSESVFKIFKAKIVIEDINDNFPEFPEPEITISIPESVSINYTVPISGATDRDTGLGNGVESYDIIPADRQFRLTVIENLDGIPEVGIVVRQKLDREQVSSYHLEILAKDGGRPAKTGSVKVTVLVTDVNDHAPVFRLSVYNITVQENLPDKTAIIQVQATDEDTGPNGDVNYRFSSRTLSKFSNVFKLDTTTGDIHIIGKVDYEAARQYRLVVEAVDKGTQPRTSQALVMVNLLDVNDNPPSLKYNFLPEGDSARISENDNIGDFVAHISALDKDNGENAIVDCKLDLREFRLERLYDNEFQINLNTKLDRETKSEYNVTVTCQDRGQPSLSVSGHFLVDIIDENDNEPKFELSSYIVSVKESATLGEGILQISAKDNDTDNNGKITYEVTGTNSSYFRIDRNTGMLSIKQQIDHETASELTFHVIARDGGVPQLRSTVTVVVKVLDVNDEYPKFNHTSYKFNVTEEGQTGTVVGSVLAFDPDQGLGGQVRYKLRETPESKGMFVISEENGVIRTNQSIDRESNPSIHFFVVASDMGENSLSSTVGVTVKVQDINDNSPVVRVPSLGPGPLRVYTNQSTTVPFVKISAKDPDDGENGTLSYAIENGNSKNLFRVNSENGDVFLQVNKSGGSFLLSREDVSLLISVTDQGIHQRVTLARLNITVIRANNTQPVAPTPDGIPNNFVIVIAVICATTFISVIIIVTIFIIRRKHAREDADSSIDSMDKVKQKNDKNIKNGIHDKTDNHRNMSSDSNMNGKPKKGVNFIFENEDSLLSEESSTDPPPTKMAGRKPVPHDVIRQQKPLEPPNSMNLLWLDAKQDPGRSKLDDLSCNLLPSNKVPPSAHIWLHDPRGDAVFDGAKRPDDETSNVSGETVTSDSGRGGSEDDVHSRRLYPMEDQESLAKDVAEKGMEGEYVDMQRSPLSYMAALRKNERLNTSFPDHYHHILTSKPRQTSSCEDRVLPRLSSDTKLQLDHYTRMSPINESDNLTSLPPPVPPRHKRVPKCGNKASRHQNSKLSEPMVKINVGKICRSSGRHDDSFNTSFTADSDVTTYTYDDDDSATTTSGSYTIDDLSDCGSHDFETANV